MNKTKKTLLAIAAILVCILCFVLIYVKFAPRPETTGSKAFELVVSDGTESKTYTGKTDAPYLAGLLDQLQQTEDFTYESAAGDYGTFITSVNGIKADDSAKTYWAIYVNGEYGQYGADAQPVNDGDAFSLNLESYG